MHRPSLVAHALALVLPVTAVLALPACDEADTHGAPGSADAGDADPPPADAAPAPDAETPDGRAPDAAAPDVGVPDGRVPDAGPPPADATPPAESYWPARPGAELANDFTRAHPAAFARLSRYATHVTAESNPTAGRRGALGLGNGHVFAFTGYANPLNTLHSLVGPTYEKHEGFFGDYRLDFLDVAGEPLPFVEEHAVRSLSAPVALTRGRSAVATLDTVDFAPDTDDPQARRCFVRVLRVQTVDPTSPLTMRIGAYRPVSVDGATLVESRGDRRLFTRVLDFGDAAVNATPSDAGRAGALTLTWPPAPMHGLTLSHCTLATGDTPPSTLDVGALLDETTARSAAATAPLTQYDLPDPMLADFVVGMVQTLTVQTAATGASCPMSEYTRTWARDNLGPGLAWLALGGHAQVLAMLDYLDAAIRTQGDLANSYPADLDPAAAPPPPDWDTLPPLAPRVAAETPSYLVMLYAALMQHTGDRSRAEERWGLLRRSMFAVAFGPDRMLPFTGDETYRAAMNAAFGLALEFNHETLSYSANSTLLWLGAARGFGALAAATSHAADARRAAEVAAEVEAGLNTRFRLPDGCLSPFVDRATGEAWPAPFEDVALQALWGGWQDGDAPEAQATLQCTLDRLRVAPGELQSPLAPRYANFPLLGGGQGIYTGMLPGYTLYALTEAGHPEAAAAFRAMADSLDTSGNFQEDHVWPSRDGLSIAYDPSGELGDYTAKFRPWEGGINLHAALDWISGFRPNAIVRTIRLRPHLPAAWPGFGARGLRIGEDRFDLAVAREAGGVVVTLVSRAAAEYTARVRWDASFAPAVRVGDAEPPAPSLVRRTHFGQHSVEVTAPLPPGGEVRLVFSDPAGDARGAAGASD